MSSSFRRRIYSEVEEVGWEHLVKMGDDLTFLSFRLMDNAGRSHILEIELDRTYPRRPPSISVDMPYNLDLEWSSNSKLRDVVHQFQQHVNQFQDFWATLHELDQSLWVTDPIHYHHAMSYRQINIGNDCWLQLSVDVNDPLSLPECRFLGSDSTVNSLRSLWRRNCKKCLLAIKDDIWLDSKVGSSGSKDKSYAKNLAYILNTQPPLPRHLQKTEEQTECGICYAQSLPIDDELGAKSGSSTDYRCENGSCSRAFHTVCLVDWLRSITTTRQSFDVLFGNCPYCSDPIAVKISLNK